MGAAESIEISREEEKVEENDDSTFSTKSTSPTSDSASLTSRSSSASFSQRSHSVQQSVNGRERRRSQNLKTNRKRAVPAHEFSLHGMAIESVEIGTLSHTFGSPMDQKRKGHLGSAETQFLAECSYPALRAAIPMPTNHRASQTRRKLNPHLALRSAHAGSALKRSALRAPNPITSNSRPALRAPTPVSVSSRHSDVVPHRHSAPPPHHGSRCQTPSSTSSVASAKSLPGARPHRHHTRPGSLVTIGTEVRTFEEVKKALSEISEGKDDDRLPAPWHETERKVAEHLRKTQTSNASSPMKCPVRSQRTSDTLEDMVSFSHDAVYLQKLYDRRTWNMYKLISESRHEGTHQASSDNLNSLSHFTSLSLQDGEIAVSTEMIFDME